MTQFWFRLTTFGLLLGLAACASTVDSTEITIQPLPPATITTLPATMTPKPTAATSTTQLPQTNVFDGEQALVFLNEQMALGPRYPGSEGHLRVRRYISVSGKLVTEQKARQKYEQQNIQAQTMVAFFSRTNHLDAGSDLVGLEEYFTNNMAVYRVQEKRKIRYVQYSATNYLEQAESKLTTTTNVTEMVNQIYLSRGADSFTENGEVMSEEAAKEKIKQEELEKAGMQFATADANKMIKSLSVLEELSSAALELKATELGITTSVTPEFTRNQLPPGIRVPFQFTTLSFELTEEDPIATPYVTQDSVFIMALEEIIPSHPAALEDVRVRVVSDFKREKQLEASRTQAEEFYTTLTNELAAGKSFSDICATNSVDAVEVPPFTQSTRFLDGFTDRRIQITWLRDVAFALKPGEVSEVTPARDGAGIVFLKEFASADADKMTTELEQFTETLRNQGRNQAYTTWLNERTSAVRLFTGESEESTN